MTIITSYTTGGLGNLLFMLANIYSLSRKYGQELILYYLDRDIISNSPRKKFWEYEIFKNFKISDENIYNTFTCIHENGFKYNQINLNSNTNYIIYGYYQSYKYFSNYKKDFINILVNPYIDEINKYINGLKCKYGNKEIISLHFRRTDYLKNPTVHNVLPLEYYLKALENFDSSSIFLFFSDDIQWVKELNVFDRFVNKEYFDNINEELCLWLMSRCDHNIIANSTFSLWANYLNENPYKKTVVPSKWFGPSGPAYNIYDLVENIPTNIIIDI